MEKDQAVRKKISNVNTASMLRNSHLPAWPSLETSFNSRNGRKYESQGQTLRADIGWNGQSCTSLRERAEGPQKPAYWGLVLWPEKM